MHCNLFDRTSLNGFKQRLALPAGFFIIALCSSCGGGSSENANSPDDQSSTVLSGPVSCVINIEQRFGKTLLDAWFVANQHTSLPIETSVAAQTTDECVLRTVPRAEVSVWPDTDAGIAFDNHASVLVAEQISVLSREGEYTNMTPMHLEDLVVYSTRERWLDDPLPSDASLNFSDATPEWPFGGIPVEPLEPIVVTSPSIGVLDSVDSTIEWEIPESNSLASTVTLQLAISQPGPEVEGAIQMRTDINCVLVDDGSFKLPQAQLEQLSEEAQRSPVTLFIARKKRNVHRSGDSVLVVKQVAF